MNAIMKLTAVAIGALGIAGGVAVAQGTSQQDPNASPDTANVGTPPGAALKRDGSISAKGTAMAPADQTSTDTSAPAPAPRAPKADRN